MSRFIFILGITDCEEVEVIDKADDAPRELPIADARWKKAAKDAVRDDEDLPSTEELNRTKIWVKTTREDSLKTEKVLKGAPMQLFKLLEDESIREPWRLAIEQEVAKLQEKLAKEIEKIDPLLANVSLLLGLSWYLGDSGEYDFPPRVINPDPSESLNSMINAPAWKPAGLPGNIANL